MWANHWINCTWDIRNSDDQSDCTLGRGGRTVRNLTPSFAAGSSRSSFRSPITEDKIYGCPVFMIYDLHNLVRGLGGGSMRHAARWTTFRDMTARVAMVPDQHLQLTASERACGKSQRCGNECMGGSTRDAPFASSPSCSDPSWHQPLPVRALCEHQPRLSRNSWGCPSRSGAHRPRL